MGRFTLGVDLDGTVADWLGTCAVLAMKDYGVNIWPSIRRQKNAIRVEELLVQYQHTRELYDWLNPIPYAAGLLRILARDAEIIYVTGRPLSTKALTVSWLKRNRFPEALVVNVRDSKVPAIKRLGVSLFIEDRLKYAGPIAENGTEVFLLDVYARIWKDLPEDIKLFRNWRELYLALEERIYA